jgi:hypothetical protein
VVTTTSFAPTVALVGTTAVIVVELTTTTLVAATPPIVTPVAPVNPVPVIVIGVVEANGPDGGATEATVNHCAYKVVLEENG